jgi:hypothetical protein
MHTNTDVLQYNFYKLYAQNFETSNEYLPM